MLIQTYEIEEIANSEASTMAADAEAIELIQQLGLSGQLKLSNPETATRFPYPRLSASQAAVFETLFPEKASVRDYAQGIIPLRVLQVIAFCKDQPQTKHLEIWHAESVKEDPILIGAPESYSSERYLLARWGDALPTFEEMTEKALVKAEAVMRADMGKALSKLKGFLENTKDIARAYLATGSKPSYSVWD